MILRYGIPDTAAIINTFLYEEGIIHDNDMSKVIARNLTRRCKVKVYKDYIPIQVYSLYFDGKKDLTKQPSGKFEREEHITIVSETGTKFITHVMEKLMLLQSVTRLSPRLRKLKIFQKLRSYFGI